MQSSLSHRSVCGGHRAQIAICVAIRSYERRINALQNSLQRALQTANLQRSEDPAVALEMSSDGDALERDDVDDDEDLDEDAG